MAEYLLGIDNGGTAAKAALFGTDGGEIAVASRTLEMLSPKPGHTERDMNEVWQATAEAIRNVLAESKIDPKDIIGIATAGHGNGLYLVDKQGYIRYWWFGELNWQGAEGEKTMRKRIEELLAE